ncbi:hypothetical protein SDJN03_01932, partial [Cucurbita argyrosperma subsp. sororia]
MAQLAASCGFGYPATDPPLINCLPASWISVKWAVLSQPMAQKPSLDCSGPRLLIFLVFVDSLILSQDAHDALLSPKFQVPSIVVLKFIVRWPLMKLSCDFIVQKGRNAAFGLKSPANGKGILHLRTE